MKCICFNDEEKEISNFLRLPYMLYDKNDNMQNDEEIKDLLLNRHILSKYFTLTKFNIYDEESIVGRFILTSYPDDKTLYIGFFECINDKKTAEFLFNEAYKYAKEHNYERIVGPVDASFWIKYRLKINLFDRPYTGEPYNKDYYQELFLDNKYELLHHYTSYHYDRPGENFHPQKYEDRLKLFSEEGYKIVSPTMDEWDETISHIYHLIMDLYSDFPIFKYVSEKDFIEYFMSYKKIVDLSMIKVAYYHDEMVGFFISVPNYHNLVYHTNKLTNLFKILKIRHKPQEYVMLYMGVNSNHHGLGKALVMSIIQELSRHNTKSIGALMKDGKVTQTYVLEKVLDTYEYALYERKIS